MAWSAPRSSIADAQVAAPRGVPGGLRAGFALWKRDLYSNAKPPKRNHSRVCRRSRPWGVWGAGFAPRKMTRRPLFALSANRGRLGVSCPQKDSNLRTWLRRPVLYPLSYGGSATEKGYQYVAVGVTCASWMSRRLRHESPEAGNLTQCDAWFGAGPRR